MLWIAYERLKHQAASSTPWDAPTISAASPIELPSTNGVQFGNSNDSSGNLSARSQPISPPSSGDWHIDNAAVVETEAELRAAIQGAGGLAKATVVVRMGAVIQLSRELDITRSVRLVGERAGSPTARGAGGVMATIVGAKGEDEGGLSGNVLTAKGHQVTVEVEGLRIEGIGGRFDHAIGVEGGASLTAVRCEVAGSRTKILGEGTYVELFQCRLTSSKGDGLCVYDGASVLVDGGSINDAAGTGVVADGAGARVKLKGVRVESNGMFGFDSGVGAVAELEAGCQVQGNKKGDYVTFKDGVMSVRGKITGVHKSLIENM